MMKYKIPLIFSFLVLSFFTSFSTADAVSLIEAPVVNGVVNSAWQYQGSVNGIAWYMKGTYFSNPEGTLQFATSADFSAYLSNSNSGTGSSLTSDVPIGPGGGLNPGWSFFTNGWYFKNPNYSNESGSLKFGTLNELNAYLSAEQAKKVVAVTLPTTGCTGYENNPACRPEWAEAASVCIAGTIITSSNNTNGQCKAYINDIPTLIQTCNPIISDGPCRPERVNPYATAGIARRAEATAKVKGYTATCSSTKIPFGLGLDPNTGLRYYYNVDCTINGKTGIGAEYMINGSDYWWTGALPDYLSGKSSTITATSVSPSTPTTQPSTIPSGSTISGLPAPTISQAQLAQIGTNIKNQSISYIRELMDTYTKQLEQTRTQLNQSFSTNTNETPKTNSIPQTIVSSCAGSLNIDLRQGSTGDQVERLTDYLVSKGFLDTETNTFSKVVFDAVVSFQEQNKSEILAPVGLTLGTGFVGPSTRKFINKDICPQTDLTPVYTEIKPTTQNNSKVIFTSNVSGIMHVGDNWNIVVTGLNPNETIYATGGKKVNGVVPQDKTPYYADNLGIYSKVSAHEPNVVGDWELVWTRADGTQIGKLVFTVEAFALPYITSISSSNLKSGSSLKIFGGNFNQNNTVAELVNKQGGVTTLSVTNMDNTSITANIPSGMVAGEYNVQLHFVGTGVSFGKISNSMMLNITN